jgi:hypothetical protein
VRVPLENVWVVLRFREAVSGDRDVVVVGDLGTLHVVLREGLTCCDGVRLCVAESAVTDCDAEIVVDGDNSQD